MGGTVVVGAAVVLVDGVVTTEADGDLSALFVSLLLPPLAARPITKITATNGAAIFSQSGRALIQATMPELDGALGPAFVISDAPTRCVCEPQHDTEFAGFAQNLASRSFRPKEHGVAVAPELGGELLASFTLVVVFDVGNRQLEQASQDEVSFVGGEFHARRDAERSLTSREDAGSGPFIVAITHEYPCSTIVATRPA